MLIVSLASRAELRLLLHPTTRTKSRSNDVDRTTGLPDTTVDGRVSFLCEVAASISLVRQVRTVFLVVRADKFQDVAVGK